MKPTYGCSHWKKMRTVLVRVTQQLLISLLLVFAFSGCSNQNPVVKNNVHSYTPKSIAQLGAEMQQAGVMSQKDYIRVVSLQLKTSRTHTISDEDFAWTLSLLATTGSSLARARAMTVLSDIHPLSSAQKAKITAAIAPYVNSRDPLDAASARSVQISIQRT